jgi:hypothetical protein
MLMTWLNNLLFGQSQSRPRQGRPARERGRASFKPALEGLEDRQLLSATGLFSASAVTPDAVWYSPGSGGPSANILYEHVGTYPSASLYSVSLPNVIVQVSAGKGTGGNDAVFVLDSAKKVWEVIRSGSSLSTPKLIATGVMDISASAVTANTVFTISAVDHSVSEYRNSVKHSLGLPGGSGPFQATDLSAGKDGKTGQEAVFVNFNGAVYEHTGLTPNKHWSYVAGVNLSAPHIPLLDLLAIGEFSASQTQGDTVFVVDLIGSLYEQVGHATGTNTPLSYNSYFVTSGVSQVSAGVNASGRTTVFTVNTTGSVDEYTYHYNFFTQDYYFSQSHIAVDFNCGLSASPVQGDTIYYGSVSGFPASMYEHSPQHSQLVYVVIG